MKGLAILTLMMILSLAFASREECKNDFLALGTWVEKAITAYATSNYISFLSLLLELKEVGTKMIHDCI